MPLLRWLLVANGALMIVIGVLLLVVPGRTLTFVATLVGVALGTAGVLELVAAFERGITPSERLRSLAIASVALVAAVVVVLRPEGSVRAIALVAGAALVVLGLAALLGVSAHAGSRSRRLAIPSGALAVAAGVALIVWPEVTVGALAIVFGIYLVVRGAVEVVSGVNAVGAGSA